MKNSKNQTKSQIAYEMLRKMILAHEFAQEFSWSLRALAKKFNMSVVPITEAVRRLEQEGIICVTPQRGISIANLSPWQLKQINVIREGLEIQAARIVAMNLTNSPAIEALRQIAIEIEEFVELNNWPKINVLDYKLHRMLVEASGNEMLCETYDRLLTMSMVAFKGQSMECFGGSARDSHNHIKLIDNICSGDPEKAEKAVREHIRSDASQ